MITTWIVEDTASHLKERHGTSQCLVTPLGLLESSEPVLHASWANQQITLPIMPDATAYLQSPDTHWNSPFKADLRHCKEEVQFQGEVAAMQQGDQYNANWGLAEIAQTLAKTAEKFVARNDSTKIVLRAGIENQQFIYRPDKLNVLECIADQQWFKDQGFYLDPPSKGIKPAWARSRRTNRGRWVDGKPPEPDYSKLQCGPWLHGPSIELGGLLALEDKPEHEAGPVLDCRIEEFFQDMTEEEKYAARAADARMADIYVPDVLMNKARKLKKRHNKGKSCHHKWAQENWRGKLHDKYSKLKRKHGDDYKNQFIPQASKRRRLTQAQLEKIKAMQKNGAHSKGGKRVVPPGTPAPPTKAAELPDHPHKGLNVQVSMKNYLGILTVS